MGASEHRSLQLNHRSAESSAIAKSARSVADPLDVLADSRVDLDHVPFLDEPGHIELCTGFDLGRFGDVGRRIPLGTRVGFGHQQFDVGRRFEDDRDSVEQRDGAGHSVLEELPSIASDRAFHFVLLEGRTIHENVVFALAIEILDVGLLHVGTVQRVAALVSSIEHCVTNQIAHPALVERIAFARLDEVHFDHHVRLAVDLNLQAFFEIACIVRCHVSADSVLGKWK